MKFRDGTRRTGSVRYDLQGCGVEVAMLMDSIVVREAGKGAGPGRYGTSMGAVIESLKVCFGGCPAI